MEAGYKMQSYKMNQCIYIVLHFAFKKRVLFEKRKGQNNSIVFAVQENDLIAVQ